MSSVLHAVPEPPPFFSLECEQALLGAILVNPGALDFVEGQVTAGEFFEPVHGHIFGEAQRLYAAGRVVSPISLKDVFPADFEVGPRGACLTAMQYLARLAASATSVINAADYAKTVREFAKIRAMLRAADDLRGSRGDGLGPTEATERFLDDIDAIRLEGSGHSDAVSCSFEISAGHVVTHVNQVATGEKTSGAYLTGLVDLDRVMQGFKTGDLVLCAGRPGMGKSTLATGILRLMSSAKTGCGFFSHEMPELQTASRMLSDHLYDRRGRHIHYNEIIIGDLKNVDTQRLIDAQEEISLQPLLLDYSPSLTVPEITAKIRRMKRALHRRGHKLRIVGIDYLKFVRPSDRYRGYPVKEIGEISGGLKELAKVEDIAILLLSQLNREVEKRENKRPRLDDLRDSGELEQDADVVLFPYREAYYIQTHPDLARSGELQARLHQCINVMEVDVAKNRNGPTGRSELFCDMACAAVRNLLKQTPQPAEDVGDLWETQR